MQSDVPIDVELFGRPHLVIPWLNIGNFNRWIEEAFALVSCHRYLDIARGRQGRTRTIVVSTLLVLLVSFLACIAISNDKDCTHIPAS